jgi:glucose-6-phosphate isomerase
MDISALSQLTKQAKSRSILSLFEGDDNSRAKQYSTSMSSIYFDYSKQNITDKELVKLFQLTYSVNLKEKITAQFSGEKINNTEQRAVLHTALRAPITHKRALLGSDADEVIATEVKMAQLVDDIAQGKLLSASGKKFTDVIAVGIGGSYYGIKTALSALNTFHTTGLNAHIIANVDGAAIEEKLAKLNPETSLVVVISKTFTTQETLLNALAIKGWMLKNSSDEAIINNQWFAVSSNVETACEFGIKAENILPMWDWVGGRFSVWSAVGFPLALVIGNENFAAFKQGAFEMDVHFQEAPFENNMPILMAALGIWNRNILDYPSLAILPYDHSLRALPGYLQQTDMESNGKSVNKQGEKLGWQTAPIVFGQEGTNGQHAFMQLMHQSDDIIPTDFIVCLKGTSALPEHHKVLVANCFAQSEALMRGKTLAEVKQEMMLAGIAEDEIQRLAPHKTMKGNTPSNTLVLESLTPASLGALLALYEHKIFVQGVLWQVNSFDQWGVELGKQLSQKILTSMSGENDESLSMSTQSLIKRFNDYNQ